MDGFLPVEGGTIYYEVQGEGPPLLLIHGGLGSMRMWDLQAPSFAERYRVIRYDQRGSGRTVTEDVAYLDADDAVAVLDHVGAASAHVIGQSRGGSIGLDVVVGHPERVEAFVSVAGGVGGYTPEVPGTPPPWDEMERLWEAKRWEPLAELETRIWVDGWGQPPTRVDPEIRRTVYDWILEAYAADTIDGQPKDMDPPAVERLAEVRAPTLVMIGTVDEPGSIARGRFLAASVAGARLEEFEGVAHMIQLEAPERFERLVLDFLAAVDRGAGA